MRPSRYRQIQVRPLSNPTSDIEMGRLDTVPEDGLPTNLPDRPAQQTSFLIPLSAVAAVTGSIAVPFAQSGLTDTKNLYYQVPAAVGEAAVFSSYACVEGPKAVMAYLGLALFVMEVVESLCGFGSPNTGNDFLNGYTNFSTDINDILENAIPVSGEWDGAAADQYAAGNALQQDNITKIAQADKRICARLQYQSELIDQVRQGMATCRLSVSGTILLMASLMTAFVAYLEAGPAGLEMAMTIAAIADSIGNYMAALALIGDLILIVDLLVNAANTKSIFHHVKRTYEQTSNDAEAIAQDAGSLGPMLLAQQAVAGSERATRQRNLDRQSAELSDDHTHGSARSPAARTDMGVAHATQ